MSDPIKPPDRGEMLARLRDGRRRAPAPPERDGAAERAARRDAEMAAIGVVAIPPALSDAELKQAARRLVEQIVAIGQAHLNDNPYPSKREDDMRELAAAVRGLVPLFDELALALENSKRALPEPQYRFGALLRLIEGALDVARIAGPDAIAELKEPRSRGGKITGDFNRDQADLWRIPALEIAKELRAKWNISQDQIAAYIEHRYKLEPAKLPGLPAHRQIIETIQNWERNREMSRRNKLLPKPPKEMDRLAT
jgi:hypothetical protein